MNYFIDAFKNCTDFTGKATRREYWLYKVFLVLFLTIAFTIWAVFPDAIGGYLIFLPVIFIIANIAPTVSMAVRRMNDIEKSPILVVVGVNFFSYLMNFVMISIYASVFALAMFVLISSTETIPTVEQGDIFAYIESIYVMSSMIISILLIIGVVLFIYYLYLTCLPSADDSSASNGTPAPDRQSSISDNSVVGDKPTVQVVDVEDNKEVKDVEVVERMEVLDHDQVIEIIDNDENNTN